jgi:hypothetical protein
MIQHQKKILLLSKKKIASPFFSCYAILQRAEKEEIVKKLQAINAGNVIIRYSLDPQQYWKERTCYEKNLHGDKQIHLFFFDKAVLCEKL